MTAATLKKKDFQSDQQVRWCPGCGDYAILSAVQTVLAELGRPRERTVIVSGIGCSSRFPYYMRTYGFHTIHGRAPAIATGLKVTRPDLDVWVVTGDGDALSIGGNHLIHALRRNVGLKILLFNNRIYGLTKGQFSPTSELGKRTKSSPLGNLDAPFEPLALALGAGATFVARSVDVFQPHLRGVLRRAAAHRGTAFVEIYQNCNIFNDGAFRYVTGKEERRRNALEVEHGRPLLWGEEPRRGLRWSARGRLEAFAVGEDGREEDAAVWDEADPDPTPAFQLARLGSSGAGPVPIGVLRAVERPGYEDAVRAQLESAQAAGDGSLEGLLRRGDLWRVRPDGTVERSLPGSATSGAAAGS